MNIAEQIAIPLVREKVDQAEWQTRVNLAAAYRLVALYGWDDLVFTHISARVPDGKHHFLINPYGMMFDEITASSLVKVDIEGNIVMETPFPIAPAGFVIHSAIHAARENAQCVLHIHSDNGIAVSAQPSGVLPLSQQSAYVLSSLSYHDYEGFALNDDEKPRLVQDLGDSKFLMLRNHGLLTVGETIADAFVYMYLFERVCSIQVRAQSCAKDLIHIDHKIIESAQQQARKATVGLSPGALNWPGLLRKLDRIDPTYKT
jgi:ribulose-5-phosphate 4-epimerase/fuculose-1-phosphate aldolase